MTAPLALGKPENVFLVKHPSLFLDLSVTHENNFYKFVVANTGQPRLGRVM